MSVKLEDFNQDVLKAIYHGGVGVPEGYEPVKLGVPGKDDLFIGAPGGTLTFSSEVLGGMYVDYARADFKTGGLRLIVRKITPPAPPPRSENVNPPETDWLNNIRPEDAAKKFFKSTRKVIYVFRGKDSLDGADKWRSSFGNITNAIAGQLRTITPHEYGGEVLQSVRDKILEWGGVWAHFIHIPGDLLNNDLSRALIGASTILNAELVYVNNFMTREELLAAGVPTEKAPGYKATLPECIIVDLDGTLADSSHRDPLNSTDEEILADKIIQHVSDLVISSVRTGKQVIFLSARGNREGERAATERWLPFYGDPILGKKPILLTREVGDNRDDRVVKLELYEKHIRGKYNVRLVLDDRPKVVRLWHDLGLPVLANQAYVRGEF